jgi:hypothetical protein
VRAERWLDATGNAARVRCSGFTAEENLRLEFRDFPEDRRSPDWRDCVAGDAVSANESPGENPC